jgi:hypothetical protein
MKRGRVLKVVLALAVVAVCFVVIVKLTEPPVRQEFYPETCMVPPCSSER